MNAPRDYYEVLGVTKDADRKAIKDAFRNLALKYHPDRNKEPGSEERFKEIAEAYAVLSDPRKRADYDAGSFPGVAGVSAQDLFGGINFEDIFGGLNFDFGGGGPFEGFFHRRRAGPPRGANVEVDLAVSLLRVASGGEEEVRIARPAACPSCHGTGEKGGVARPKCQACGGTGRLTRSRREKGEHVLIQEISTCPTCHGRGDLILNPCGECQGSGEVGREETLTVKIPPGVEEGMALRIPGKGMPSPATNGVPGDLYVVVRTWPDARFQRVGADLLRQERLALPDAVLGTRLEVPTLEGTASVSVPPGTQPDALLRLRGKGLPHFGNGRRGDLILQLRMEVPQRLSSEERRLYEQLRHLGGSEGRGGPP